MRTRTSGAVMNHDDAKLDRIRKILAKAEDPAVTPAEADAYNEKADALIAAYGIDRAMLAAGDPGTDIIEHRHITFTAPYMRDRADLAWAVADPLRVCGILRTRRGRSYPRRTAPAYSMDLIGFTSDLDRVQAVYESLLIQLGHGLAQRVPYGEHPSAYRRGYIRGFCWTVESRLRAAERNAAETAGSTPAGGGQSVALVLADRAAQVQAAVKAAHPDIGTADYRDTSSYAGEAAGSDAALGADLGQPRISGSRSLTTGGAS